MASELIKWIVDKSRRLMLWIAHLPAWKWVMCALIVVFFILAVLSTIRFGWVSTNGEIEVEFPFDAIEENKNAE